MVYYTIKTWLNLVKRRGEIWKSIKNKECEFEKPLIKNDGSIQSNKYHWQLFKGILFGIYRKLLLCNFFSFYGTHMTC